MSESMAQWLVELFSRVLAMKYLYVVESRIIVQTTETQCDEEILDALLSCELEALDTGRFDGFEFVYVPLVLCSDLGAL